MRGTFRRDLRLETARGGFTLTRRPGPRVLSVSLVLAAAALAVLDALWGKHWIALAHGVLCLGFLALLLRAELDRWEFDGEAAVRRTFALPRLSFDETRLTAKAIQRIGIEHAGKRARCWIETKGGEQYALVEGEARQVEEIAERLAQAVRFAKARPETRELH